MIKDYDCECIFYLGIQIIKYLELEDKCLYIDEKIDEIEKKVEVAINE